MRHSSITMALLERTRDYVIGHEVTHLDTKGYASSCMGHDNVRPGLRRMTDANYVYCSHGAAPTLRGVLR